MRFTYFAAVASLLAAAPHAAAFVSQWYPPDEVTVGKPVKINFDRYLGGGADQAQFSLLFGLANSSVDDLSFAVGSWFAPQDLVALGFERGEGNFTIDLTVPRGIESGSYGKQVNLSAAVWGAQDSDGKLTQSVFHHPVTLHGPGKA